MTSQTIAHRILVLRFGLEGETPHTLGQVSEIVGISREKVRQSELHSLHAIKAHLGL